MSLLNIPLYFNINKHLFIFSTSTFQLPAVEYQDCPLSVLTVVLYCFIEKDHQFADFKKFYGDN